ncbi:MAG: hypothetical protein SPLM_07440 [Spiroplasma phoeniceum]|uniref:RidA family protein n=1 Tax=Spiroplasma phoeniceum TaxID=47835 RepID=UPI00328794D4
MQLEASYLVWINYEGTKISPQEVNKLLLKYKLIVSKNDDFVEAPITCFRINIGTSFAMVINIINILTMIFKKSERAVKTGNFLYVSGQLPLDSTTMMIEGTTITEQTKCAL